MPAVQIEPPDSATERGRFGRIRRWLGGPRILWWVAVVGFVLTLPSVFSGFSADDYFIRAVVTGDRDVPGTPVSVFDAFAFSKRGPEGVRPALELGLAPWWAYAEGSLSFWRPLSALTHWADFALFPRAPWLMHLHNSLWYIALGLVLALLYRRFEGPAWAAGLAALLYIADDAHGMGVGWIASRNGLLAAVFGFLALLAHDRWRRDNWKPGAVAGPLSLAVGLLCGESAVAVGAYLFAHALFLDRGRWTGRLAALMPYAVVVLLWRATYTGLGYGVDGTGFYLDPGRHPVGFSAQLVQRWPVLLLGQLGAPSSGLWTVVPPSLARAHLVFAAMFLVLVAWLVWPLLRHDPASRFFALGMALAAVPSCATFPNDRLLFYVGFGGMGLVVRYLADVFGPEGSGLVRTTRPARYLAWFWIAVHVVAGPLQLPVTSVTSLFFGRPIEWAADTLPELGTGDSDRVVIVNVPADLLISYAAYVCAAREASPPPRSVLLTAGRSAVEVRREDDRTLVVGIERGLLATPWGQIFRDPRLGMRVGDRVELDGLWITVTEVTDDGRPSEMRFAFDVPLEDDSLRWVTWSDRGYAPFAVPAPSETVRLEPLSLFWWI